MPNDPPITSDVVAAYCLCQRKAYLLLRGEQGEPAHPYVVQKELQAAASLMTFLELSKQSGLSVQYCIGAQPTGRADVLAQIALSADDLQAMADALVALEKSVGKGQSPCEPHLAIGTHSIAKADKIRLAFIGHVLGNGHRHRPQTGVVINAAGDAQRIKLPKLMAYLKPVIDTLKAWKHAPATVPPPILLNDHCPICPFKKKCLEQAEKDDSLTLLDRMTPKVMRKYHKKGIFTITQLSYLFKPRRQRKKRKDRPAGFNLELQALALRTGKIYLHQSPNIPQHSTELFLDMEGVPDQGSTYLIGLVIQCEGKADSHSLWADCPRDEKAILEEFLGFANRHPDAPIYHYGSYEPKALVRMAKETGVNVDAIASRLVNVNKFIYGKVYFPTRSNTLKDLGRFFGATWRSPDASGLQSVVWRMQWQASGDATLKEKLLAYNIEDCNALAILVSELRKIGQSSAARPDVDFADTPKRNATPSGQKIHDSLEGILRSAHAEYTKSRIQVKHQEERPNVSPNGLKARNGHLTYRRIVLVRAGRVIRVKRRIICPRRKGKVLVETNKTAEHTLIDLAFTRSGCRKVITKYVGTICYCTHCGLHYPPPAIGRLKNLLYGHSFRAWAVYQRISLRVPHKAILQVIYDLFREQISDGSLVYFISGMAKYYASTEKKLLDKLLASPIHSCRRDETQYQRDRSIRLGADRRAARRVSPHRNTRSIAHSRNAERVHGRTGL